MDLKLSIIVPVYKVEDYLEECVDSLLRQTIGDFEIILVDDGSPDRSGEIADRYAREYPEIVHTLHVDNGGQGRARNFALEIAQGDYLGFVDSDDWIADDMYEKLCTRCEEAGADIAVCDWLECYPDGRTHVLPAGLQDHRFSTAGSACNKVFKRALLGDTRFPEGMWYEDFYFSAMLMLKAGAVARVSEPLYNYRIRPRSTMHNNDSAMNLDLIRVMELLGRELSARGMDEDYRFLVINHVLLDAINRVTRQNTPDRKQTLSKLRSFVHGAVPDLSRCESFRAESFKRRLIMKLNYWGLHDLSRFLLDLRSSIS